MSDPINGNTAPAKGGGSTKAITKAQEAKPNSSSPVATALALTLVEPYVIYKNGSNGEWRLRCPFHPDVEGDCSLNVIKGAYTCFKCGSGSMVFMLDRLSVRAEHGFIPSWLGEPLRGSGGSRPSSSSPPSGPPSADVLSRWHLALLRTPEALSYLLGPDRLLTIENVKRWRIGWSEQFGFYSIPIYDRSGNLVSFKRYRRDKKPKMLNRRGDTVTLFPWSILNGLERGDLLVVCEGEWDAMLLIQSGIPAITGGGATVWKSEWSIALRRIGVQVVVIYDSDASGRLGRSKPVAGISGARALDLAPSRHDGYDVTQYLSTHSVDQLLAAVR